MPRLCSGVRLLEIQLGVLGGSEWTLPQPVHPGHFALPCSRLLARGCELLSGIIIHLRRTQERFFFKEVYFSAKAFEIQV